MSTLHNNQLNIGLQMSKVKLPKLMVENVDTLAAGKYNRDVRKLGVQNSNVLHYLGYKGAIKDQRTLEICIANILRGKKTFRPASKEYETI